MDDSETNMILRVYGSDRVRYIQLSIPISEQI